MAAGEIQVSNLSKPSQVVNVRKGQGHFVQLLHLGWTVTIPVTTIIFPPELNQRVSIESCLPVWSTPGIASRKEVLVIADYSSATSSNHPTAEPKRTSTALPLSSKTPMGPPFCHIGPALSHQTLPYWWPLSMVLLTLREHSLPPKKSASVVPLDLQTIHNGVAISEKGPLKWVAHWDLSPCYCFHSILLHFLLRNFSVFPAAPPVCCPFPSKPQYWVRVVPWVGSGSTAFKAAESKDNYFPQFIVSDMCHISGRKFC